MPQMTDRKSISLPAAESDLKWMESIQQHPAISIMNSFMEHQIHGVKRPFVLEITCIKKGDVPEDISFLSLLKKMLRKH